MPESCREGVPASSIGIVGLRVVWRTPEQARFHWETAETVTGRASVSHYELWVANDAAELQREEPVLVYDGDTNPELARGFRPGGDSSEQIEDTTATGLEWNHAYVARLLLYDNLGALACSNIVPIASSLELVNEIPIFEDALPASSFTFLHRSQRRRRAVV